MSSSAPRLLVHTALIPMRWGDMDAYQHVNNTVYFRYMEQARVEYLERLGDAAVAQGTAPVIVKASATFLVPLSYPGIVEVRMFLGAPGRSSIPSSYEIRVHGDATLRASGDATIVWIDMQSGKSAPIPDAARAPLAGLLSAGAGETTR